MREIRPETVVLLGVVARSAPRLEGIRYIETYHPTAAMRFPKIRREFEKVFTELGKENEKVQAHTPHGRHRIDGVRWHSR